MRACVVPQAVAAGKKNITRQPNNLSHRFFWGEEVDDGLGDN